MDEYGLRTKIRAVNMVIEEGLSCGRVAKMLGLGKRTVQRWVKYYESLGEEGLKSKKSKYNSDFKKQVVEYVVENKVSYCKAALLFDIPHNGIVRKWVISYLENGSEFNDFREGNREKAVKKKGDTKLSKDYSSLSKKELLEEIERLDCENAYLKKLDALLQEKAKSPKKKK